MKSGTYYSDRLLETNYHNLGNRNGAYDNQSAMTGLREKWTLLRYIYNCLSCDWYKYMSLIGQLACNAPLYHWPSKKKKKFIVWVTSRGTSYQGQPRFHRSIIAGKKHTVCQEIYLCHDSQLYHIRRRLMWYGCHPSTAIPYHGFTHGVT